MGSSSSRPAAQPGVTEEPDPYVGPAFEHKVIVVNAKIKFSCFGSRKSNVNEHMEVLAEQYGEHYKLDVFFRVPYTWSRSSCCSDDSVEYQAVLSRPTPHHPSTESWELQVHQTCLYLSKGMRQGVFQFSNTEDAVDEMSNVFSIINEQANLGGRLIRVECTGKSERREWRNRDFGVNMFFDMPLHTNPQLFGTVAYCTTMEVSRRLGSVNCNWDFNGPLSGYVSQGWRLVDVIIPQHEARLYTERERSRRGYQFTPAILNVIWFFEKEQDRIAANDNTPRYQVTVNAVSTTVTTCCGSAKSDLNISPLLSKMGPKGWKVVSVLNIPNINSSGFMSFSGEVLIFLQRAMIFGPPTGGPEGMDPK